MEPVWVNIFAQEELVGQVTDGHYTMFTPYLTLDLPNLAL